MQLLTFTGDCSLSNEDKRSLISRVHKDGFGSFQSAPRQVWSSFSGDFKCGWLNFVITADSTTPGKIHLKNIKLQ